MFLTAIKDTFYQIGDANKGYNVYINQKIREREREEKNNYVCGNAARSFLSHLAKHQHNMSDEKKWKEISTMWDIWNMSNEEFNKMIAWMLQQEGYETAITDGYEDGGIDIKGTKGTKEKPEYIAVQCKNWKFQAIRENDIDAFYGKSKVQDAKNKGSELLFVTSSHYTQNALKEMESHKIDCVDYLGVMKLYIDYKHGTKQHS